MPYRPALAPLSPRTGRRYRLPLRYRLAAILRALRAYL